MIQIDGSKGEGGGQVLRTSLAYSVLTGQPVHLFNIRANRRNPGLAPQHLSGVLTAAQICDASVEGARLRSTEVTFEPGDSVRSGEYQFDISQLAGQGSAGAVPLLLQTLLLPLALAQGSSRLVLRGGTHVAWSPPVHYVEWVLLPTLSRIGIEASITLDRWGWYPQGGGQVEVEIRGNAQLSGIDLTRRGKLTAVKGIAAVSNLPAHIPQRIANRANNLLKEADLPAVVQPVRTGGHSTGAGLFLMAEYEGITAGFSALGKKGKASEQVASEAADELIAYHQRDRPLEPHLPDQIIPMLAWAEGESTLSTQCITRHTLTNIRTIGAFIEREIVVEGEEGQPGTIRVT